MGFAWIVCRRVLAAAWIFATSIEIANVGFEPGYGLAARLSAIAKIKGEARITHRHSSEPRCRNLLFLQIVFDPFQQGHMSQLAHRESLVFYLCS